MPLAFSVSGDSIFYNGDIVLDKVTARYMYGEEDGEEQQQQQKKSRRKRAAMRLKDRLWPKGIVYYVFADNICKFQVSENQNYILICMKFYTKSCNRKHCSRTVGKYLKTK